MFTKLKELNAAFVLTPNKYPLFRLSEEQKKIKRKGSLMKVISLHVLTGGSLILNWGPLELQSNAVPLSNTTSPQKFKIKARMKLLEILWLL